MRRKCTALLTLLIFAASVFLPSAASLAEPAASTTAGNSNDHNHNSSRSSCVNDCSHCNNVDTCCCNDASNNDHDTGDDLHRL